MPIKEVIKVADGKLKPLDVPSKDGVTHIVRDGATDIHLSFYNNQLKKARLGWMYSYGKMAWADIPRLRCNET